MVAVVHPQDKNNLKVTEMGLWRMRPAGKEASFDGSSFPTDRQDNLSSLFCWAPSKSSPIHTYISTHRNLNKIYRKTQHPILKQLVTSSWSSVFFLPKAGLRPATEASKETSSRAVSSSVPSSSGCRRNSAAARTSASRPPVTWQWMWKRWKLWAVMDGHLLPFMEISPTKIEI